MKTKTGWSSGWRMVERTLLALLAIPLLMACGSYAGDTGGGYRSSSSAPSSSRSSRQGSGSGRSGVLTAGSFDDNLNPSSFKQFLEQAGKGGGIPEFKPGERIVISVQDSAGRPVGGAKVLVSGGTGGTIAELITGSDGRALYLTGVDGGKLADGLFAHVSAPGSRGSGRSALPRESGEVKMVLEGVSTPLPSRLDLAFVVDATGSMGDEIRYLKAEAANISNKLQTGFPGLEIRYALIVYRDSGDSYVTRSFGFTTSLDGFLDDLGSQTASGGGDYPEAMHKALADATRLQWSSGNAARVLFLIADAPPHNQHAKAALTSMVTLRRMGVRLFPVAASGVAAAAEYVMRAGAFMSLGQYLFLTDDSGVGNTHAEPHIPCYHVERLNGLMIRMIASQLAGKRLEATDGEIIRTVGRPVRGVCGSVEQ